MRKTKIVCTLGPSTDNEETLRALILAGMNVARFNFSHGTHAEQKARMNRLKQIRREMKLPVAAMMDTKGPEIRLGCFTGGAVQLMENQTFTLTPKDVAGDSSMASITYPEMYQDVKAGTHILIDDGLIDMEVVGIEDRDVVCRVINGGRVSDRKGVNVPNAQLHMPFISPKDRDDILFAIREDFDFIAASFTRSAEDIMEIRRLLKANGRNTIHIIAKIENQQGIDNLDEILEAADGIMVARGDLGVEIPMEEVPAIQKTIIRKTCQAGKQVITATQMLDSMMNNPRPTRAEVTDVANAIYQGTSAVMLSGETAAGKYPVESVQTMAKIALRTEANIDYRSDLHAKHRLGEPGITNAISHATCTTADDLNAAAIITVTKSGVTAKMISRYRPPCPIIGCTTYKNVCRQLNLSWGIIPLLIEEQQDPEELFAHAVQAARSAGLVQDGDVVVLTAGVPLGIPGKTNMIRAIVVGE